MMNRRNRERISIDGDDIVYTSSVYGSWRIAISDVRVIGEYTNQNGPFADDYFFVFVTKSDNTWFEASFYAEGRDEILKNLAEKIGCRLEYSLCGSTDFVSNVLWPAEHIAGPMFEFKNEGLLGKLGLQNKQRLAAEIVNYVKRSEQTTRKCSECEDAPVGKVLHEKR